MQLNQQMILLAASAAPMLCSLHGEESQGHAVAELLSGSSYFQVGVPIRAAVRMAYDAGWHGYWINPGEAGMKTEITWKLPPGWKVSELEFPLPEHSSSKGLAGFLYHGTILIPVTFTAPADAAGKAEITGEVRWLACNEKKCVAGTAVIRLEVSQGIAAPTADAAAIEQAFAAIPQASPQHQLLRRSDGKMVTLQVVGPELEKWQGAEISPITEQALDLAQVWRFSVKDGICSATGPINEYASDEAEQAKLDIVVRGGKLERPVKLNWSKKM